MAESLQASAGAGHGPSVHGEGTRRDYLFLATGAVTVIGVDSLAWPFIDQMNPSADTLALSTTEIDISHVEVGQAITVLWRGKPVFVRHRTPENIKEAEAVNIAELRDPQTDAQRVQKPEWLVMVGVCTHLGCVPLGQKPSDPKGEFGGWFCPCHGSQYDTSGRIRKGPAPRNLEIPAYIFETDTTLLVGAEAKKS
jgi:ubiquinol-cytochrome c reductase iron-sulfur subunit